MSAHTPGPWEKCGEALFGRAREDGGFEPIGFVYCPAFPEKSEVGRRAQSNLSLIAAAPDLLAVLQEAEARPLVTDGVDWWIRVRAAIAKATPNSGKDGS